MLGKQRFGGVTRQFDRQRGIRRLVIQNIVVLTLLSIALYSQPGHARRSGPECLVVVKVSDSSDERYEKFYRSWIKFLVGRNIHGVYLPGGLGYVWDGRQKLYVLVGDDCPNKINYVQGLIAEFLLESQISHLQMKVDDATNPPEHLKRGFERHFSPQYARRDCIVKIEVFDQIGNDKWVPSEGRNWVRFMMSYVKRRYPRISPFVFKRHYNFAFVMFKENCNKRIEMAKELTSAYMAFFPSGPRFLVHKGRIEPGPDTTNWSGSSWTDTAKPLPSGKP